MVRSPDLSLITELNSRTPGIPTIVLCDSDSLNHRLNAIRAGASSFLTKPVTPEIIWQATSKLIAKQRQFC